MFDFTLGGAPGCLVVKAKPPAPEGVVGAGVLDAKLLKLFPGKKPKSRTGSLDGAESAVGAGARLGVGANSRSGAGARLGVGANSRSGAGGKKLFLLSSWISLSKVCNRDSVVTIGNNGG